MLNILRVLLYVMKNGRFDLPGMYLKPYKTFLLKTHSCLLSPQECNSVCCLIYVSSGSVMHMAKNEYAFIWKFSPAPRVLSNLLLMMNL